MAPPTIKNRDQAKDWKVGFRLTRPEVEDLLEYADEKGIRKGTDAATASEVIRLTSKAYIDLWQRQEVD